MMAAAVLVVMRSQKGTRTCMEAVEDGDIETRKVFTYATVSLL